MSSCGKEEKQIDDTLMSFLSQPQHQVDEMYGMYYMNGIDPEGRHNVILIALILPTPNP
jgi:hypothetical protein